MDGAEAMGWAAGGFVMVSSAALAVLAWWGGPRRGVHAALASYLVLVGALAGTAVLLPVLKDRFLAYNVYVYNYALVGTCAAVYLVFVGQAVQSPFTRWLRARLAVALLLASGVAWSAWTFLAHASILDGGVRQADGWWLVSPRPDLALLFLVVTIAPFLFGMVASIVAWRSAPRGSVARQRARAYALVFILQDATFAAVNLVALVPALAERYLFAVTMACMVVFVVMLGLLVRALLRWHLFDFDLKLKLGVKRGSVAVIMLGAVFLVGQIAQGYFSTTYGLVAGAVAAAIVLLLLRPIERVAERIADTAMPRVHATPEYVSYKKLEVYRAAVESALESGGIDAKERTLLARMRAKLGLADADADALEADVRRAVGAA